LVILEIILLIIGFVAGIAIVWTIGWPQINVGGRPDRQGYAASRRSPGSS
jgi:hypothetical protein